MNDQTEVFYDNGDEPLGFITRQNWKGLLQRGYNSISENFRKTKEDLLKKGRPSYSEQS
jgi:hypothetical protein